MKLVYFAWVRERIGQGEEEVALPREVSTVRGLIDWLRERGEGYGRAFADLAAIRVAVNQEYVTVDHPVSTADEVAFFPPMTGG